MSITSPPTRPRITTAEQVLTTLVNAGTVIREAAYADLPAPSSVLVPHPGHLWLIVDDAETVNRWANWLGAVLHHRHQHTIDLRVERFGLEITLGAVV